MASEQDIGISLEVKDVKKSFGQVLALKGVSLSVAEGCILGLAGGNGAGKSTLSKCIAGYLKPDGGEIVSRGRVSMVPQEFMLVPGMKVYENMFLGRELKRFGLLDRKEMVRRSAEALARIEADIDPAVNVESLGVAARQKVEIAKAVLFESAVLIMDEPTAVLNKDETEKLFALLRSFRADGGAVIYITHRLYELMDVCDEVCIMRDGEVVSHEPTLGLTPRMIAQKMVGRGIERLFPDKLAVDPGAEVVLEAAGLSAGSAVRDVSFSLRKGEVLGVTGLAGAGRTELAETICGVRRRTGGTLRIRGRSRCIRSMHDANRAGISYLSEDRQGTALLLDRSVASNIVMASLPAYAKMGFVNRARCRERASGYVARFGIKTPGVDVPVSALSGGNQQKVAIAKGLDTNPRVFIFDEPTRGVDVAARSEIYGFIHSLAEGGVSCILISSDLEEVINNCGRALVMRGGSLAGELEGNSLNEEEIMCLATGVK